MPIQYLRKSDSESNAEDHSSYGAYSSSGSGSECCPLVVDPLTYLALLAFLAAAVYLLNELIAMSMLMMVRKKRHAIENQREVILMEG